jgi:tetratricopeptide (TPR) repeat protein
MKCLEKDRNRRYETPSSLARDIERFLHDEPVQACPPSTVYRLRKYARRNKVALAFATLLVGGLVYLAYSNAAIKRERDAKTTALARAQAVSDLLQEMLGSADAERAKGVDYKVRELLDDFASRLGNQLTDQPAVEADIRATIGRAYRSLKLPKKARPHFEKAIELQRQIDGPQSEELAAILVDYAWNLHDEQRHTDAESQVREALEIYRRRRIAGGPLFHALGILQYVLITQGRYDDAERVIQQALDVARQAGKEFPDHGNLLHCYADLKIRQGDFAEAEKLASQSIDLHRRLRGDQNPDTGWALWTLSRALEPQQKLAGAETAMREAVAIFGHQFPPDHPHVRNASDHLRTVLEAREAKDLTEPNEADQAVENGKSNE